MSHTRTPVSASVIKSSGVRFAPRAVPRKHTSTQTQVPKPVLTTAIEDDSESEDELADFLRHPAAQASKDLEDVGADTLATQGTHGIPTIQSSSSTVTPAQVTPIIAPTVPTTSTRRLLRSAGPVPEIPIIQQSTVISSSPTALEIPATEAPQPTKKRKRKSSSNAGGEPRRRGGRAATPPGSEDVVIQPATMTMSEMCIDRRTGKKSSRYPELQEAERQRRRLRTLQRDQTQDPAEPELQDEPEEPANGSLELAIPAAEEDNDDLIPASLSTAMLMTDSNGNIIIDRSTLQIDRQPVHPSQLTDSLIHTTETIFSSKVNSGTYPSSRTHASSNIRWLPADNEAFYQALQMFGTDFDLVAEWVGGKTRRHVKNKFYREEKRNEDKLTWALKNRIPADVGELERRRGRKLRKLDEMEEWQTFKQEAEAIKALPRISESQAATEEKGKGKARETLLGDF